MPVNGGARENWPRAGLEAFASGVPVVAQNQWGWREMIEHGVTGFLGDSDEELAHYAAMLAYDEDLRMRIVHAAHKRLVEKLANPDAIWAGWQRLFHSLGEPVGDVPGIPDAHTYAGTLAVPEGGGSMITVVVTTWPNHPRRVFYCEQTLRALTRNLSATGHEIRWLVSAESRPADDAPWSGQLLEERLERLGLEVRWRDAEPSLPGHLNDIVSGLSSPLWFYVQDDWELIRPLDLGPAADLLLANDDLGGVRYWANTGYSGEFKGFLVIDPAAAWSYGDNPALWHMRFNERVGPFDAGGSFGTHEGTASARLASSGLRILADPAIRHHAAHYFFHLGEMSSIPGRSPLRQRRTTPRRAMAADRAGLRAEEQFRRVAHHLPLRPVLHEL